MIGILTLAAVAALFQQPSCEALRSLELPDAAITSAEFVPAGQGGRGGAMPEHCRVAVVLQPSADSHIEMELWMPAEDWNGKFLAVGNGGWAGSVQTNAIASGLREGYAAASNDTGHTGPSASFAPGHPEKLIDFGYRAMHEMAVQSKTLIGAFYDRGPELSYYQGCSTGGRQGMMAAQRYPEDFDGIIAGAPVYNVLHLNTSQVALQVDMLRNPETLVQPEKIALFADAVVQACDARDGVEDGIISEPRICSFDPAVLTCTGGDSSACLTPAQAENARSAYMPVTTRTGDLVYPGRSPGFESGWRIPTPDRPLNALFADTPRYIAHGDDPDWDVMSFDLARDLALALGNGGFIEAGDPDLSAFRDRGGKLLLYHGWADPGPAPENTINYYEAVTETLGGDQDDWMRLFLMPGVGHCGGGVGPSQADFLGALETWRESGAAPDRIIATRSAGGGGAAEMSRPLCPFPQVARYTGTGSTNDAASFTCVQP
jgi:feruloyl esterase